MFVLHFFFSGSCPSQSGCYCAGLRCHLWNLLSALPCLLPLVLLLVSALRPLILIHLPGGVLNWACGVCMLVNEWMESQFVKRIKREPAGSKGYGAHIAVPAHKGSCVWVMLLPFVRHLFAWDVGQSISPRYLHYGCFAHSESRCLFVFISMGTRKVRGHMKCYKPSWYYLSIICINTIKLFSFL